MFSAIPKFAQWPGWVQTLVVAPHAILGFIMTWLWWPEKPQEWRRFGILAAYLLMFLFVMLFVSDFDAK